MDFSDLMNIASNKQQVTEKKIKSKKSKDSDSRQVSSDAVKAFLAKQNAQKAIQKEQEEAAKRARIQARLQREQKDKSKKTKNADASTTANDTGNRKQSLAPEVGRRRPTPDASIQSSKRQAKPNAGERQAKPNAGENKRTSKERSYVESKGREGRNKKAEVKRLDKQLDDKDKSKAPSKVKKAVVNTLSFQQLMNVAEKQINNPDAIRKLIGNPRVKEVKPEKVESNTGRKDRGKDEKLKTQAAVESPTSSKISKGTIGKRSGVGGTKKKETSIANVPKQKLPVTQKNEVKRSLPEKPRKMTIERRTVSEMVDRHPAMKRRYDDYDDDDDYDDEMDEFIDDGEATADISSYIKDIFGYDRNKFHDRDDDVDDMVSSFADIQREEAKSSRIAKLEDEIERLKETFELEQQEKKLKH